MKIISIHWEDVPEGAIVLCPDGKVREIGPHRARLGSRQIRRHLGLSLPNGNSRKEGVPTTREHDAPTLVVQAEEGEHAHDVFMAFMRAGFSMEFLPG